MPHSLDKLSEIYRRDGAVLVPGLLSPDWVARLKAVIDNVCADEESFRVGRPNFEVRRAPGRASIRWLWRDEPDVAAFFTDSDVASTVAKIIGAGRLQYWYDLTFVHEPGHGGAGSPWHHDIAAFPFDGQQIPSLWIALTDVNESTSPLRTIRGSHLNPAKYRPPVYVDQDAPLPQGYQDLPDVQALVDEGEWEAQSWPCQAGDALIIHPYTLHGAPPNENPNEARIGFTTRWMGDDVVWTPNPFSLSIPGVDYQAVPIGQRPSGPLFPDAGL